MSIKVTCDNPNHNSVFAAKPVPITPDNSRSICETCFASYERILSYTYKKVITEIRASLAKAEDNLTEIEFISILECLFQDYTPIFVKLSEMYYNPIQKD